MYQVSVAGYFDAAHYLRGYQGKCEKLHGHRFKVVATIKVANLDEVGLAYDFVELKGHLERVLARFDHTCLNDISPFDRVNPSSENIAATTYSELQPLLSGAPVTLTSIEVWESPQGCVTYSP